MKALLARILAELERIERDIHRILHLILARDRENVDNWDNDHPDS